MSDAWITALILLGVVLWWIIMLLYDIKRHLESIDEHLEEANKKEDIHHDDDSDGE